jgi:hypothetical protein
MPSSALAVVPTVLNHMVALNPASILDIGAGFGKYGVLFREYCPKHPMMVGVEAWEPYVVDHRLRGIYDVLMIRDVLEMSESDLNWTEAVFMGDVIEHLDKDAAVDLLARIHKPIVINTPEHFFHNGDNLPWTETHRSHWTLDDFRATGRVAREETVFAGLVVTLGPTL